MIMTIIVIMIVIVMIIMLITIAIRGVVQSAQVRAYDDRAQC